VNKLFQTQCLYKEMTHSKDATFRSGDNRVPVDGTLQYRWADSMSTLRPETGRNFMDKHPTNADASPFYMTGGTKRSHPQE
jgi:hypothetical protein